MKMVDGNENGDIISCPENNGLSAVTDTIVSRPPKRNADQTVFPGIEILAEEKIEEKAIGEEDAEELKIEGNRKNTEEYAMGEETREDDGMKEEANAQSKGKKNENVDVSLIEVIKPRKRKRGKKAAKVTPKVASKDEDKPESSTKKKVANKVESMGMIFMCSSKTKTDCYKYKVFGLPANKKDIVEKIYNGMRLFLYDFELRLMYGIYKAAGPGGSNIEPKAFKSAFPSQVRFTVLQDCLPVAEEKFKKVIKDNYYSRNKFDCQLNSEQVKKLCRLFIPVDNDSKAHKVGRGRVADTHISSSRGKIRRHDRNKERGSAFAREPRHNDLPVRYAREPYPSKMAPLPRIQHLPPAPVPLYGERKLDLDPYRREPALERPGLRLTGFEPRSRDETGSRDPYFSFREREAPSYPKAAYMAELRAKYYSPPTLPAEYYPATRALEYCGAARLRADSAGVRAQYYSPNTLPADYRLAEAEYRGAAGIKADSGGLRAEYYFPSTLPTEYRPAVREVDYRSAAGIKAGYHSSASVPAGYHSSVGLLVPHHAAGVSADHASSASHHY